MSDEKTKFQSVASWCQEMGVKAISEVRENSNNYPFVTMISDKFEGGAQNIYFSKAQSAKVALGQPSADLGLKDLSIAHTSNADGELRLKITSKGESSYTDIEDLF
jgi:hypothetical protein